MTRLNLTMFVIMATVQAYALAATAAWLFGTVKFIASVM